MSTAIIRGAGPRDGFPDYIIRSLSRNEIGVFAGFVERQFKIGPVNQRIDPAWLLPENAPRPWSIPCKDTDATIEKAMCIVTYRYQGGGDTVPTENEVTYNLDSSMAEKPIQTHPKFSGDLEVKYDWGEHTYGSGQIYTGFSQYLDSANSIADQINNALTVRKGGKLPLNPLFGTDTYFSVACVFTKRYAVPTGRVSATLLKGIGTIVPPPQGIGQFSLPSASQKRNWLKMSPLITKRGDLVEIEERTALSHIGGWKKQVYSSGQLDEESGEKETSLTTGGL